MHLFVAFRGIKHETDMLINELSAQFLPYKIGDEDMHVQLAVRPIQLVEIVFPDEYLDIVQRTLWGANCPKESPTHKLLYAPIRKILSMGSDGNKVMPMPPYSPEGQRFLVSPNCVAPYPIGIKKDNFQKETLTKLEKQKLEKIQDELRNKAAKENL